MTDKEALKLAREPVAWVDLLKKAEEVVRCKSLWKKYIDGTPLANDIAVWMANFAQEHSTPPQRQWVGLTDEELIEAEIEGGNSYKRWASRIRGQMLMPQDSLQWHFSRAIEAKLKGKNT